MAQRSVAKEMNKTFLLSSYFFLCDYATLRLRFNIAVVSAGGRGEWKCEVRWERVECILRSLVVDVTMKPSVGCTLDKSDHI